MLVQTFGPIPVVTSTGTIVAAGDPPIDVDPTDPEVINCLAAGRLVEQPAKSKPAPVKEG